MPLLSYVLLAIICTRTAGQLGCTNCWYSNGYVYPNNYQNVVYQTYPSCPSQGGYQQTGVCTNGCNSNSICWNGACCALTTTVIVPGQQQNTVQTCPQGSYVGTCVGGRCGVYNGLQLTCVNNLCCMVVNNQPQNPTIQTCPVGSNFGQCIGGTQCGVLNGLQLTCVNGVCCMLVNGK